MTGRHPRIAFPSRQIAAAVCLLCSLPLTLEAQPRGNRLLPRYVAVAPPDQEEGRRILAEFRQLGLPGDYYLELVLEVLPRRGPRREVPGRLWGSRNERGPVSRLALMPPGPQPEERLLAQGGADAGAWHWRGDRAAEVHPLPLGRLFTPLAGTTATAFDLQMPFMHWPEFVFEGVTKTRGRTVHAFLLYPPPGFAEAHPDVGGVRIYLDLQFHALMQAVVLDAAETPVRRMTVLDLKSVQSQWIVKSIDLRDEVTRDKTRLRFTGAALGLEFGTGLFAPATLAESISPPDGVERFN